MLLFTIPLDGIFAEEAYLGHVELYPSDTEQCIQKLLPTLPEEVRPTKDTTAAIFFHFRFCFPEAFFLDVPANILDIMRKILTKSFVQNFCEASWMLHWNLNIHAWGICAAS